MSFMIYTLNVFFNQKVTQKLNKLLVVDKYL